LNQRVVTTALEEAGCAASSMMSGVEEIHHAALMHSDGMVVIESERPEELHGSHSRRAWVYVAVGDVDGHYRRVKAAGVDVLNEPQTAMGGAQRG
jgi:uncharacterized glyoxalase superfamily protein PhnB